MSNKERKAHVAMLAAKTMGGLNVNALKYLLPVWLTPVAGVTVRMVFGCCAFWLIGLFAKPDNTSVRDRLMLFLLGAFGIYGYMFFFLTGLSMTTPISSAIFASLQPIWVFVLMAAIYHERVTRRKVLGISLGLAGALLCILTQKSDDLAQNAFWGNVLNFCASIAYAIYLIASGRLLKRVRTLTLLRYTFLGGTVMSLIVSVFAGFHAPLLQFPLHLQPIAVLLFVLFFPTLLTYLLTPVGLKNLSTTAVAIYGYLALIVTTVASLVLGQDRFSWAQLLAILLIVMSVYWVEVAEKRK